jgi:thiamine pyrophosphate-dependent acetolactate synthase large subunit-like protein
VEHQPLVNRLGIGEVVSLEPIMPFAMAQRKVADADALLVVPYDRTSMPTKLFEYFAFQKPILGLATVDGDTADVMKACLLPVAPPNDVPAILAQLRKMLSEWELNAWGLSIQSREAIERFHIDHQSAIVTEVMERLVDGVAARKPAGRA